MKRLFVAVLLLLVTASQAFAEIRIRRADRVANRDPGYCAWCCLSMVGRHQKIKVLYNLVDQREKEFTWQWDPLTDKWFKSSWIWTDYGEEYPNDIPYEDQYVWVWIRNKAIKLKCVHKDDNGHHWVYEHRAPAGYHAICNRLNKLGVKFKFTRKATKQTIKELVKNNIACIIVVKDWWLPPREDGLVDPFETHAIIIVDFNDDGIEFIDPNDVKNNYTATQEWLDHNFVGYVIVLE